jgi:hypothetical protein
VVFAPDLDFESPLLACGILPSFEQRSLRAGHYLARGSLARADEINVLVNGDDDTVHPLQVPVLAWWLIRTWSPTVSIESALAESIVISSSRRAWIASAIARDGDRARRRQSDPAAVSKADAARLVRMVASGRDARGDGA